MRLFLLLFLCCSTLVANADTQIARILGRGLLEVVAGPSTVPAEDKSAALLAISTILPRYVTFRPDGTVAATCIATGNDKVEWVGFVVKSMKPQPLTDADEVNLVTKSYIATLSCRAHRVWDYKKNFWGNWQARNHSLFPTQIKVIQQDGRWIASVTPEFRFFRPSAGLAIAPSSNATRSQNLPHGMTAK